MSDYLMSEFGFETVQEVSDEQKCKINKKVNRFGAKFHYEYPTSSHETNTRFSLKQLSRNISRKWNASTNPEALTSCLEEMRIGNSPESAKSILADRIRKKIAMLKMRKERIKRKEYVVDEIVFTGEREDEWDSPT